MAKIDTAYIKANVICSQCKSSNLVRRHKQSFKTVVDSAGDIVPEFKVNWRVFECSDCEAHTHVTDDGNQIIESGYGNEYSIHPFSCFDFCVNEYEGELCLEMYYKPKVNEEFICEDDLRDELILGFKEFFRKQGFHVDNLMENTWALYFLETPDIDSWDAARDACIAATKLSGAKYDAKLYSDPDHGMGEFASVTTEFDIKSIVLEEKLKGISEMFKPSDIGKFVCEVEFGKTRDPWG